MRARRSAFAALFAAIVGTGALTTTLLGAPSIAAAQTTAPAAAPQALTPWDVQHYTAAFGAAQRGDHAAARAHAGQASDPVLVGWLESRRILTDGGRTMTYDEVRGWLETNRDHPDAARVHAIALRNRPAGAPAPALPVAAQTGRSWNGLAAPARRPATPPPTAAQQRARDLFYEGRTSDALLAANESGERWIAGLAAFRLRDYAEAQRRFETVARDEAVDSWNRSAGAYWASRAAIAAGQPELAPGFLRMAASHGQTFYGLIAQRQLGLEPQDSARGLLARARTALASGLQAVAFNRSAGEADPLPGFIRSQPRAKRAAALAQIGLLVEAGFEVRDGLSAARDEDERRRWVALAAAVRAPMIPGNGAPGALDETAYPMPTLTPNGGFTLDRALVYAIVRQESRFNPSARSHAGATGLMQLMPGTARQMSRSAGLDGSARLTDPGTNLRLGQDYVTYLLRTRIVGDDILRAVAAYNGGPGTVLRTQEQLAGDQDALMLIESLPYAETRAYVERVMANYWIYRRLLGQDSPTMDAVASGSHTVRVSMDRPQQQAAVDVAPVLGLAVAGASTPLSQ